MQFIKLCKLLQYDLKMMSAKELSRSLKFIYKPPPSRANNMDNNLYIVERILAKKRTKQGQVLYRVKWKNWSMQQSTWQPIHHLEFVPGLVKKFQDKIKRKVQRRRKQFQDERRSGQAQSKSVRSLDKNSRTHVKNESIVSGLQDVDRNQENKKQKTQLKIANKSKLQAQNKHQQDIEIDDLYNKNQAKKENKLKNNQVKSNELNVYLNENIKVRQQIKKRRVKSQSGLKPEKLEQSIKIDQLIQVCSKVSKQKQSNDKQKQVSSENVIRVKKIRKKYKRLKLPKQQQQKHKNQYKQIKSDDLQNVKNLEIQIKDNKQCIDQLINFKSQQQAAVTYIIPSILPQNIINEATQAQAPINQQSPFIIQYKLKRGRGRPKKQKFSIQKSVDIILQRSSQSNQEPSKQHKNTVKTGDRIQLLHKIQQNIIQKPKKCSPGKDKASSIQELKPINQLDQVLQQQKSLEKQQSQVIITQGIDQQQPCAQQPKKNKKVRRWRRRNIIERLAGNQAYRQKPKRIRKKRSFAQIFLNDNNADNFPHIFSSNIVRNTKPIQNQLESPQLIQQVQPKLSLLTQLQRCPTSLNNRLSMVFNSNRDNNNALSIQFINQNDEACLVQVQELEKHCGEWLKNYYQQYI